MAGHGWGATADRSAAAEQARRRREDLAAQWMVTSTAEPRPSRVLRMRRRHVGAGVHVLPPLAVGGVSDRVDATGGGRLGRHRNRPCAIDVRADHHPAHHPRKATIKDSGVPSQSRPSDTGRVDAVLRVLYLTFNEGYASTRRHRTAAVPSGGGSHPTHQNHPRNPARQQRSDGLLALMLLVTRGTGHVPRRWVADPDGRARPHPGTDADRGGRRAHHAALPRGPTGPYQIQAAIAASTTKPTRTDDRLGADRSRSTGYCFGWTTTRSSPSTTLSRSACMPDPPRA